MPPDDPLGKDGPTLDFFLSSNPSINNSTSQTYAHQPSSSCTGNVGVDPRGWNNKNTLCSAAMGAYSKQAYYGHQPNSSHAVDVRADPRIANRNAVASVMGVWPTNNSVIL